MKDFTINKPPTVGLYELHRAVAGLCKGEAHLWRDNGDTITIRTAVQLHAPSTDLPEVQLGAMHLFKLRASVSSKVRGRHIYPTRTDHGARRTWLDKQGTRHGFDVVALHSACHAARVADNKGRDFTLDATDFIGVLKVTDTHAFQAALHQGVGSTGKAFGFSLLSI
jgi:hypothetical protein